MIDKQYTYPVRVGFMVVALAATCLWGCETKQIVADIKIDWETSETETRVDDSSGSYGTDTWEDQTTDTFALLPTDDSENDWDPNRHDSDTAEDSNEPYDYFSYYCGVSVREKDLKISSQADWDAIESDHYTHVKGNVTIQNPGNIEFNITNLSKLGDLRCIDGNLEISSLPRLVDLTELSGLWFIGGQLQIIQNPSLVDVRGLGGVSVLGGFTPARPMFTVAYNQSLANCAALNLYNQIISPEWEGDVCVDNNKVDVCEGIGCF